jgi:DeoR family transcriptional regulator, catabolite repression regulator
MLLNERQLKILQTIEAGNTTGETIAEAMGSSTQMLKYYLDKLAEDGYIKTARVYDNAIQDFLVVRAYLTPTGYAELAQLDNSALSPIPANGQALPSRSAPRHGALDHPPVPPANLPYPTSLSSPTAAVDEPPVPRVDVHPGESVPSVAQKPPVPSANQPYLPEPSQPLDVQDIGEVIKLIDSFEQVLSILTKENRDLATVYFTDLQAEVKVPYRRNMKRINAYLKAFLHIVRSRSGTTIDEVIQAAQVVITKLNLPPDEVI